MIVALYKPEIPPNTGNIGRLCVALDIPLRIIGKPSFSFDDSALKRAGLDYWPYLDFKLYNKFKDFYLEHTSTRILAFTKEGEISHWDFSFQPTDVLLFGRESRGLPPSLLKLADHRIRIPMWGKVRSLNLSNSVAIVAYEALRQNQEKLPQEGIYRRGYYKKLRNSYS